MRVTAWYKTLKPYGKLLDANIMICAVLGQKIWCILLKDANTVRWFVPSYCVEEARKHLPITIPSHI